MLHITLEFLGELSIEKVKQVQEQLTYIISHYSPVGFQTTAINAFPDLTNPHILFLGVEETTGQGSELHQELIQNLLEIGIISEHHEWHPHITLGRIKREWYNPYDFSSFSFQKEVWNNKSVQLMESVKKESEHEYIVLHQFFFKE